MKQIFIVINLVIGSMYLMATEFNDKQKAIIYNEAIKQLQEYQDLNNQMADAVVDIDQVNKISQSMIDLFVSRKAIIYNDLDPAHQLSEVYELETYITNLLLWYPDGMKVTIDFENLKAGNIIDHGNEIFTVDLMTQKLNSGNYLNRQKNELNEELLYRIAFFQKANAFESFKIAGVRSSKSSLVTNDSKMIAEVKSVTFSDKDMQLVKDQTKSLLNDYINFLNLLADPKETAEDKSFYKVSFLDLFKDTVINVTNDIEPDPKQRYISVTDYQANLVKSYPEGIKNLGMNIDSAEYGKIIPEGDEKYYINGYIDKFFSGKYQDKTVFRDNAKYDFKVSFEKDDNTFKNFKLASIDKFGVDLYDQSKTNEVQELPKLSITSLKRSGLYLGASFGVGQTMFADPNLTDDPTLLWEIKNNLAFAAEAQATWYFHNQLGVTMGLGYSQYKANTSLYGEFQDTDSSKINELFTNYVHKVIIASYDSLLTFSYINVPISIIYHSNKVPNKWGVYAQLGLLTSFNIGNSYETKGDIENPLYSYTYPEGSQYIREPDWGYVKRTNIAEQGKTETSSINMSATVSIGITCPLAYFTSLYFGPELVLGMSNILNTANYTDAYGNTGQAKDVKISRLGVKFGISHKF